MAEVLSAAAEPVDTALDRLLTELADATLAEALRAAQDFAQHYAPHSALRDQLILLAMDFADAPPHEEAAARTRLAELLKALAAEHHAADGSQALSDHALLEDRLRTRLLESVPPPALAFECHGLEKRWPGSDFTFGTLDLKLCVGEITGVVGQNGHGKTTLLRMVAGEVRHDKGSIAYPLFGQPGPRIDWVQVKRELAFVPQELPAWHGALADTLHYAAAMHGIRGRDNERDVAFFVERLGLGEHMSKRWGQLAGGFKLRFALARALITRPRLLVMDEPLANLDQKAKGLLLQDVRDLARSYRRPIAVLMSSHDLHGLEQVCTQMVFLRNGRVAYAGPSSGIGEGSGHNQFEVGCACTVEELRGRLRGTAVLRVREEGLAAIVETPGDFDRKALLRLLLERGVDLQYFRDNSRSVRRLFD